MQAQYNRTSFLKHTDNFTDMAFSLTCGVELEFLCVFKEDTFTNNAKWSDLVPDEAMDEVDGYVKARHAIFYFLNKANIPATRWEGLEAPCVQKYSAFIVGEDISLKLSDEEEAYVQAGYEWETAEIASPILQLEDANCLRSIQEVLDILHWMESEFECGFLTNESCGMHVHIGCGRGNGVPVAVVKRMFQLITAHEHLFDAIHAASRIRAPVVDEGPDEYPHYAPPSFFHRYSETSSELDNVFDWIQRIEDTRTFKDMCELFRIRWRRGREWGNSILHGHTSAINFDNLIEETKTIEFRQHIGTLEFVDVSGYVLFLSCVVKYCIQSTEEGFFSLLVKATDPGFQLVHLVCAIGPPASIVELFGLSPKSRTRSDGDASVSLKDTHLVLLKALNASRVAENKGTTKASAARAHKWAVGFYGINQAAGVISIPAALARKMICEATRQQLHMKLCADMAENSSQARSALFSQIATMYRDGLY